MKCESAAALRRRSRRHCRRARQRPPRAAPRLRGADLQTALTQLPTHGLCLRTCDASWRLKSARAARRCTRCRRLGLALDEFIRIGLAAHGLRQRLRPHGDGTAHRHAPTHRHEGVTCPTSFLRSRRPPAHSRRNATASTSPDRTSPTSTRRATRAASSISARCRRTSVRSAGRGVEIRGLRAQRDRLLERRLEPGKLSGAEREAALADSLALVEVGARHRRDSASMRASTSSSTASRELADDPTSPVTRQRRAAAGTVARGGVSRDLESPRRGSA